MRFVICLLVVLIPAVSAAQLEFDNINRYVHSRYVASFNHIYTYGNAATPFVSSTQQGSLSQGRGIANQDSDLQLSPTHIHASGTGHGEARRSSSFCVPGIMAGGNSVFEIEWTMAMDGTFTYTYGLVQSGNGTTQFLLEEVGGAAIVDDSGTSSGNGGGLMLSGKTYRMFVMGRGLNQSGCYNNQGDWDITLDVSTTNGPIPTHPSSWSRVKALY